MDEYLIWSEEHGAWWGPNHRGYTRSLKLAGRYTVREAATISDNANAGGSFCEVPVRFSLAMDNACKLPSDGQ